MRDPNAELYIHIPFCVRKCAYCDFLSAPADDETQHRYVRALQKELALRASMLKGRKISSVFFGGGTPSVIRPDYIGEILDVVRLHYALDENAEITLECNPGTVTKDALRIYHREGVNRLSIGLQAVQERLLKALGRIHTYETFLKTYENAVHAGFLNINVDLMSGIPGQTANDLLTSLKRVVLLNPKHISAYGLIVEEGTPFYDLYGEDEARRQSGEDPQVLPSEETERYMYALTREFLGAHGYEQYEISNYAKKGYACQHNVGYWIGRDYLGVGIGAASLVDHQRFSNPRALDVYMETLEQGHLPETEIQRLLIKDEIEEFMFLGLRMMQGVSRSDFYERFGRSIEGTYGDQLNRLASMGLLIMADGRIMLTDEGVDVSNYVLSEFLLDRE